MNRRIDWTLYVFEDESTETTLKVAIALAGGDAGVHMVGLSTWPEEFDGLYTEVFLPAVDAFTPLEAGA
jgi:hypothetical protein